MGSAMLTLSHPTSSVHEVTERSESYRPLVELGRGGMARVYLAERSTRGLRKLVVLKVLDPNLATDQEMRTAFRREAELCARLNHPNIVQVFEVLDEIAAPMMVMEYVEGVSLSHVLSRTDGRLPLRLHVHVVMQVLAGLQYFHELKDSAGNPQLAVHRDVSPQNVLVMHEGTVKVLDFGIAKVRDSASAEVTQAGIIKGKLSYMPAEQVAGDTTIDRRADLFAAGVMLWEAFARRRMWQGWQQPDVVKALVSDQIPSIREACPWISPGWEAIITRATAGKREERYETALDMQIAMEECMGELGGPVPQRELATFMSLEFGQWRLERQRLVDAELQKPAVPLTTVLGGTVSHSVQQLMQVTHTPASQNAEVPISPAAEAAHRRLQVGSLALALIGVTAIVAAAVMLRAGDRPQAKPAPSPETLVAPKAPSVPATTAKAEPAPVPVSAAPSLPTASAAPSGKASDRSKSRAVTAPHGARPAAAAAPSPAAPAVNCNPPFVLDSEGVKTYKPECF
jgi:eukaryotic-like serine/threonine-protein kinase